MSPVHAGHAGTSEGHKSSTLTLTIGSVGIVYGDIGTSPIYALREGLRAASGDGTTPTESVLGIVSLLIWLLFLIATLKYVVLILRADNRGEGGTLSLLALCQRALGGRNTLVLGIAIIGTGLFFGDAMITPAISVLSAVEGVALVAPGFSHVVLPVTVAILVILFWVQRGGTGKISKAFAPIMLVWFATIAGLGIGHIADAPLILSAFNPAHGVGFLVTHGEAALPVIGSVFLAITGAEALYADMGHFGRRPIRLAWGIVVLPALLLSYLGQGALVLSNPAAAADPFFLLAPAWALPILVGLAMAATVIASQAVISGAYSFAHQAVQLGLLPRMTVLHTSETQEGQIYMPRINILLLIAVLTLVAGFGSSERLATAYGIAVTGEMIITTILAAVVFRLVWRWGYGLIAAIVIPLLLVEAFLLLANLTKVADGGYLPLSVAAVLSIIMWTWVRGTARVRDKSRERSIPLDQLARSLAKSTHVHRVPGTAIYLTAEPVLAPPALLHNLKHNGVLHARTLVVSVRTANRPHIDPEEMVKVEEVDDTFTRLRLTFGYMDRPDVPKAIRSKVKFDIMSTSFFLNRRSFKVTHRSGWTGFQNRLFTGLARTSSDAHEFFRLPSNRVVELGQQITL